MTLPIHWVNGEPAAGLSPADRGVSYGDGVFETFRCRSARPHLWQYHRDRLEQGLAVLGIDCERDRIEQQLAQGLAALEQAGVEHAAGRLTVTRGSGERGYRGKCGPATVILSFSATTPWREPVPPVELVICHSTLARQPRLAGIKHCNRLEQVLAAAELDAREAQDGLLTNDRGELVCALSSNIFALVDGELLTPSLRECGIAGTVRRLVLEELAPEAGLNVREATLTPGDLAAAEELFLTSSLTGIRAVSSCEGVFFTSTRWGDTLRDSFYRWSESTE